MIKGILCPVCPHACIIKEGHKGLCGGRINKDGKIVAENYSKITAIALDPIEKKPLRRFRSGSNILSVGSYGCNLRCSFCQNYRISMATDQIEYIKISPMNLISKAVDLLPQGNIGIAYTYNEPLIGYEYVKDCAALAKESNLVNVVVTNGYINENPLIEILPFIDAFNIDLKSFSQDFYKSIGGDLETVKRSIGLAASKCHVEVTTLIIPGENDSEKEMRDLSIWLASVNPDIPLHISRFFPNYNMSYKDPTAVATIKKLAEIARESLNYVYEGNI